MFVLAFTAAVSLPAPPSGPPPTAAEVRQALGRSVTYLEKEGVAWLNQRKCIACHHGQWMLWGINEARRAGVAVDEKNLNALTERVATMYLADRKDYEKKKQGYVEGMYLMHGQYDPPAAGSKNAEALEVASLLMAAAQRPDGSWKYAGQEQNRSAAEADEATTLWAALALDSRDKSDQTATTSRDRALEWMKKAPRGEGNESLVLRLLIELKFGDTGRANTLTEELIDRQNADGGWNWSKKHGSDPYATGQSLYALGLAGVNADVPAIQAARRFLVTTQKPDGGWFAPTKKAIGGNQISSYWGSAWAVIGLARTLPAETK